MAAHRIRTLGLFLPAQNAFYESVWAAFARGFEAQGVRVVGACTPLDGPVLAAWCNEHRPDAVFEMNRTRNAVPDLPKGVRHVAWIVDLKGHQATEFAGSDLTYAFAPSWVARFPAATHCAWLGPGTDPDLYPEGGAAQRCEASFAGFVPNPWTELELGRVIDGPDGKLAFGTVLPQFRDRLRVSRDRLVLAEDYFALATEIARKHGVHRLELDDRLRNYLASRVVREVNRTEIIDAAMDAKLSPIHIHGSQNWLRWPKYASLYQGELIGAQALAALYRSSLFNLHEGTGIHFRSMDCMASGGLLLWRTNAEDNLLGGMRATFEPGVHYVAFTPNELPEIAQRCRREPATCRKIRRNAARAVRQAHTWAHRAAEVLADLGRL